MLRLCCTAPTAGTLLLDGDPVRRWRHRAPCAQRTAIGVVFQQPRLSADPRLRLTDLIAEPLRATGRRDEVRERVAELTPSVGLTLTFWTVGPTRSATASSNVPASPAPCFYARAGSSATR